eukprot:scaffold1396_cov116-Isochrysis_galbana.AAC.5
MPPKRAAACRSCTAIRQLEPASGSSAQKMRWRRVLCRSRTHWAMMLLRHHTCEMTNQWSAGPTR